MADNKLILLILDGWGHREEAEHNAIKMANPVNYNKLIANCPNTLLNASEEHVGLPSGQMGNSEVGHTNIGAGRIVYQDFLKISKDVQSGNISYNLNITNFLQEAKETSNRLHLVGLLSDGGVHSHIDHFKGIASLAKEHGIEEVYIHAITDGRDTPPTNANLYLTDLDNWLEENNAGKIADIIGRYYAMDRDNRWERVQKAWDLFIEDSAEIYANSIADAMEKSTENDEFIKPIKINGVNGTIKDGDSVFMINFRADRVREITSVMLGIGENDIRKINSPKLNILTMTEYESAFADKVAVAYPSDELTDILGEVISKSGLSQLRIAETEKYAHVTYFFNGGKEEQFEGEHRKLIASPRDVATYDLKPQMSVEEVEQSFEEIFKAGDIDVVVMNFANPDMVGHTGVIEAAVQACKRVDECLGKVIKVAEDTGAVLMVTADHGNSEQMWDYETNQPHTAHTLNKVPFIIYNYDCELKDNGKLADIAPTILKVLGIEQPECMTGISLID